jgi:hypothetical protein
VTAYDAIVILKSGQHSCGVRMLGKARNSTAES